jgi:cob(I)alamin adenosyltransferase
MKIYTKTGDGGNTGLLGGVKVSKSHLAVETCGTIDELNSIIGVVGSFLQTAAGTDGVDSLKDDSQIALVKQLQQIQNDLFDLGSRVAACLSDGSRVADFGQDKPAELESLIDHYDATLPALTAFILPSGSIAGCQLHLARSVCRRAERRLVELSLSGVERDFPTEQIYLNRLSDLLFVLSRIVNRDAGVSETQWQVTRGQ